MEGATATSTSSPPSSPLSGACVHLISVRGGRVLGSKNFFPQVAIEEEVGAVLLAFLGQYYLSHQERDLPAELIVNVTHEDFPVLVSAIAEARGRELEISYRVRGTRARWQQLAVTNAEQALGARLANRQHVWRHASKPLPRRSTWRSRRNAWSASISVTQRRGHRGFLRGVRPGRAAEVGLSPLQHRRRHGRRRLRGDAPGADPPLQSPEGTAREDARHSPGGWRQGALAMAQEVLQELAVAGLILLGVARA